MEAPLLSGMICLTPSGRRCKLSHLDEPGVDSADPLWHVEGLDGNPPQFTISESYLKIYQSGKPHVKAKVRIKRKNQEELVSGGYLLEYDKTRNLWKPSGVDGWYHEDWIVVDEPTYPAYDFYLEQGKQTFYVSLPTDREFVDTPDGFGNVVDSSECQSGFERVRLAFDGLERDFASAELQRIIISDLDPQKLCLRIDQLRRQLAGGHEVALALDGAQKELYQKGTACKNLQEALFDANRRNMLHAKEKEKLQRGIGKLQERLRQELRAHEFTEADRLHRIRMCQKAEADMERLAKTNEDLQASLETHQQISQNAQAGVRRMQDERYDAHEAAADLAEKVVRYESLIRRLASHLDGDVVANEMLGWEQEEESSND